MTNGDQPLIPLLHLRAVLVAAGPEALSLLAAVDRASDGVTSLDVEFGLDERGRRITERNRILCELVGRLRDSKRLAKKLGELLNRINRYRVCHWNEDRNRGGPPIQNTDIWRRLLFELFVTTDGDIPTSTRQLRRALPSPKLKMTREMSQTNGEGRPVANRRNDDDHDR